MKKFYYAITESSSLLKDKKPSCFYTDEPIGSSEANDFISDLIRVSIVLVFGWFNSRSDLDLYIDKLVSRGYDIVKR